MQIELDLTKSLEENAASYFEKAKKAKKKLEGVKLAIKKTELMQEKKIQESRNTSSKKEWFQKFHWCLTSTNKLVIGGRDATTNDLIIKKYATESDLVFHTDMRGSPFVVLKNAADTSDQELLEASTLCLVHSKAWKDNILIDVFYVKPNQLEPIGVKGSFVIKGETKYLHPKLEFYIGIHEEKVMGGSYESIIKHCKVFVKIVPGNTKTSDIAKQILRQLKYDDLDELIRVLPAGGCKIIK